MMLAHLLADLERLGIQVWAEKGQLRYRAPARALTEDLRAELTRHKADLLAFLQQDRTAVLEYEPLPQIAPDPGRRHELFPLTDIQHAYWIGRGQGVELGNVATHAYFEFERADLDVERLGEAWRTLIARHDMLRAVVQADGQQRVLADVPPYSIDVLDLRTAPPADALSQTKAVREQLSHHVYDAARWPLFGVRATRLPGDSVRVHVSIDLPEYIEAPLPESVISPQRAAEASELLQIVRDALVTIRTRVQRLIDEGKSEAEVIAAKPTKDLDPQWVHPGNFVSGDVIARMAYQSLTGITQPAR